MKEYDCCTHKAVPRRQQIPTDSNSSKQTNKTPTEGTTGTTGKINKQNASRDRRYIHIKTRALDLK